MSHLIQKVIFSDGVNSFEVTYNDLVEFISPDASVLIDLSNPGIISLSTSSGVDGNLLNDDLVQDMDHTHNAATFDTEIYNVGSFKINVGASGTSDNYLQYRSITGLTARAESGTNSGQLTISPTSGTTTVLTSTTEMTIRATSSGTDRVEMYIEDSGAGQTASVLADLTSGVRILAVNGVNESEILAQLDGSVRFRSTTNTYRFTGFPPTEAAPDWVLLLDNVTGDIEKITPANLVTAGGGIAGITADNGLTASTPTNVQLGGTLLQTTAIDLAGFELQFTTAGTQIDAIDITFDDDDLSLGGAGVRVTVVDNGTAFRGTTTNSPNAVFDARALGSSGSAFAALVDDNVAYQATQEDVSTNTKLTGWRTVRTTSGTAASGIGTRTEFWIENANGTTQNRAEIDISLTDVTDTQEDARLDISLANAGAIESKFSILNTGQIVVPDYGTGAITGTPAFALAVDASGNVIETGSSQSFTKELFINEYEVAEPVAAAAAGQKITTVPLSMNGMNLIDVTAAVYALGSTTGSETIDINVIRRRAGANVNMMSSPVTLLDTEYFNNNGTIDTSNDDVQTGDVLVLSVVNGMLTTDATGLTVTLTFEQP